MATTFRASLIRLTATTTATLLLLPIATSAIRLIRLERDVRAKTTATAGRRIASDEPQLHPAPRSPQPSPRDPDSLPASVRSVQDVEWLVFFERVVSQPVPTSSLTAAGEPPEVPAASDVSAAASKPSALLRRYMSATHVAFSWTPQAFLIRAMIKDGSIRRTFDSNWIEALEFAPGDVVNGVYRVAGHETQSTGSERIELLLDVPDSYTGPVARGLLVSAIEPAPLTTQLDRDEESYVVFVNETWMWRRADEKPVLLETAFGKWFHRLLSGWLILKGLGSVVASG